jgi:hypothetical protein
MLKEESGDNLINVVTSYGLDNIGFDSYRVKKTFRKKDFEVRHCNFQEMLFLSLKPKNSPEAKSASLLCKLGVASARFKVVGVCT